MLRSPGTTHCLVRAWYMWKRNVSVSARCEVSQAQLRDAEKRTGELSDTVQMESCAGFEVLERKTVENAVVQRRLLIRGWGCGRNRCSTTLLRHLGIGWLLGLTLLASRRSLMLLLATLGSLFGSLALISSHRGRTRHIEQHTVVFQLCLLSAHCVLFVPPGFRWISSIGK
jgi:hypothetical protein